jgi:hypothetical protein|mmetsp:Transcript_84079/g.140328  ORF Transcript_84079/g.140328 Transcript_84079/m.140328 type:complete len:94 (+) Transcript_84079:883-1164(+)
MAAAESMEGTPSWHITTGTCHTTLGGPGALRIGMTKRKALDTSGTPPPRLRKTNATTGHIVAVRIENLSDHSYSDQGPNHDLFPRNPRGDAQC